MCISHVGKTEGEKLDDKRRDDGAGKIANTQKKMQGKLSVVWTFFAMLVWRTLMNKIIMFLRRPATERIKSTLQTVFLLSILVLAWLFWSLCGARPPSKRNGESGRSTNLTSRGSGILGIMLTGSPSKDARATCTYFLCMLGGRNSMKGCLMLHSEGCA